MLIDLTQPATAREVTAAPFFPILITLAKLVRTLVTLKLADLGLQLGQDELLTAIQGEKNASISLLAEALMARPSAVFKMVEALETQGIASHDFSSDFSSGEVILTETGHQLARRVDVMYAEIDFEIQRFMLPHVRVEVGYALMGVEGALRRIISKLQ